MQQHLPPLSLLLLSSLSLTVPHTLSFSLLPLLRTSSMMAAAAVAPTPPAGGPSVAEVVARAQRLSLEDIEKALPYVVAPLAPLCLASLCRSSGCGRAPAVDPCRRALRFEKRAKSAAAVAMSSFWFLAPKSA